MKKLKKISIGLIIALLIIGSNAVCASTIINELKRIEYTEEYKKYLLLTDEEKSNVIAPRMFEVKNADDSTSNPIKYLRNETLGLESSFSLIQYIPENIIVKNQMNTNACWAFPALSSLGTNLALRNYYSNLPTKVYDFSARHMEYATSRTFANNVINPNTTKREVGSGGNQFISIPYLTNGTGAIAESQMQFENNENKIDISEIQNKTVITQVYDTIEFENGNLSTNINAFKNHIKNYGSVSVAMHMNVNCYNDSTGAIYCNDSETHKSDHAISIIGWDDTYSKTNFNSSCMPTSNGAWIAINSYGTQFGNNGFVYISYEDVNIYTQAYGILKSSDKVSYENIYQYDYTGFNSSIGIEGNVIYMANVFNKKTAGDEYITQVSLYTTESCVCKAYINPNGTSKAKNDLQQVTLKDGDSKTITNVGFHTLEFLNPIKINANNFAIVIEIEGNNSETVSCAIEAKIPDSEYEDIEIESGKCFIANSADFENNQWLDISTLSEQGINSPNADSTIKAFSVSSIPDHTLKNILITTPPSKTKYIEGQDFDKNGMVVKAFYNDGTSYEITDYNITDGENLTAEQTSVTISYENKIATQNITVEANSVTSIFIANPPNKTKYVEGEKFDKTGMVVKATYKDGISKEINNYIIENGTNLKLEQTLVTINYDEKITTQEITVSENTISYITITTPPNKTKYIAGENFDDTGMVVEVTYKNGNTKEISDYIIENGTGLKNEQTSVTISYSGKEVTQPITIIKKIITNISILQLPKKCDYIQKREELDLTGGIIKAEYNNGTSVEISMQDEGVTATGFNNLNVGKVTITITYETKTTTFDVNIVEVETAKNSDFTNASPVIPLAKSYIYTNGKQGNIILETEVKDIIRFLENQSFEYYYYLSGNPNEENIENWVKITEEQLYKNKIEFDINTKDISNITELIDATNTYLYIKEIAKKGGDQKVYVSDSMEITEDKIKDVEIYVNDIKQEGNINNENKEEPDNTIAEGTIPQTGLKVTIIIAITVIAIVGAVLYIKYIKLSKEIK